MAASFPSSRDQGRDPDHPLARAFASFTEAAGSLERTYGQLQGQVAHLRQELEVTNRDLAKSLEENHRIRERQRRILEGLPCGVLVIEGGVRIPVLNPEAARLLGGKAESTDALPPGLVVALESARTTNQEAELPLAPDGAGTAIWVAVRHAWLEPNLPHAESVFILRDISEAKKLERERENLRRQQALVEVSALLAHEIRNPLGSLELFAGLLAEANLEGESQRWIEHVQAGLRTLSATVNNVLHLHNTPQPECTPIDAGEVLDWAYEFLLPLARQARVELQIVNGFLRIAFDCSLVSAEHLTYREFLQRVPQTTYLASCDLAPAGVIALLQLDLAIAFPIIDVLLGGEGATSDAVRDITEIEEQVLEGIVRIICRELQTAWEPISLEFNFGQRQPISNAQRLMVPDEKNLCLSFEIKMSDTRGTLNLAVPAVVSNALLRKISADLSCQRPRSPVEARRQIEKKLLDCSFFVELSLPYLSVPLQSLAEITPGTVLPFLKSASEPAILQVEEVRLCMAAPVRVNSRRAARVVSLEPATAQAGEP